MSDLTMNRRRSHGAKITKELISQPYNFSHIQGICRGSSEELLIDNGIRLESIEYATLEHRLQSLQPTGRSRMMTSSDKLSDDDDGSSFESGADDVSMISTNTSSSDGKNSQQSYTGTSLTLRRRSRVRSIFDASRNKRHSFDSSRSQMEANRATSSSPDIELNDSAFFESLIADNGSPQPEKSGFDVYHHVVDHYSIPDHNSYEENTAENTIFLQCRQQHRHRFSTVP